MRRIRAFCFVISYLLLRVCTLCAQSNLTFKSINVDNGLPQNSVMSVLQDKKGYLWVGTFDGLSRFNGIDFKVYKNEDNNPKSIGSNKISKLFTDRDNNLWIGTVDYLNLYDPNTESFTRFKVSSPSLNSAVLSLVQDAQGVLWVGTDYGLFYVKPKSDKASAYSLVKSNICLNNKTTCLYIDHTNKIWMGEGQTLKIYDPVKKQLIPLPAVLQANKKLLSSTIRNIIQDRQKNYWIATETEGLFYYNANDGSCLNYNLANGLLSNTIRAVLEKEDHIIWVGTKKGLNIINTQTNQISKFTYDPLNASSLSQNSIRCIYKDDERNVWIGTFNGGLNFVSSQFDNFYSLGLTRPNSNGLSYKVVNTIMAGAKGDFWIGTDDGGLNHLDNSLQNNHIYYQFNGPKRELLGNSIKGIAANTDSNKLWVATGSGLNIFDKRTGTFTINNLIAKPGEVGFIQSYVLLNDGQGLWLGTNFSGLYYYTESDHKLLRYPTTKNSITALFKDGDNLWVGLKDHGLNLLNIKTRALKVYQTEKNNPYSLSNNSVLAVYKDSHNRLWIGTDGGGLRYFDVKANRFYGITESLGISNNTIHGILEDKQGRLWVSTNKGISGIAFNAFKVPFDKANLSIANYTVTDGLQSNQFTTATAAKTNSGKLIFGGINGITAFNPDSIKVNRVKPKVVFTDFTIFNKPVAFAVSGSPLLKPIDESSEITLNYNQAFFSIKFAALSYISPEKNQFAYKLEGFTDDDWHYVRNANIATYTNLNPGTYYFKIKAANNDGVWNEQPRVLKIIVSPPWWKTWYALVGYIIIIVFLLYLFSIYSRRTERLKNDLKYESISHIKDQELAQKQLSFFVNISHEIKTPLTMIMAPLENMIITSSSNDKMQSQLKLMRRNGERLIRLINQLLDKKKLESGHMYLQAAEEDIIAIINETLLAFEGLAKLKNIALGMNASQQSLKVWLDADKFEKVLYNLLSNAIKFTRDYGKITLSVSSDGDQVLISIEDNGCGIDPANIDKIFNQFYHYANNIKIDGTGLGLAFSKELVELHHGSLTVESLPETTDKAGYTRFDIKLPAGRDHLKETEISNGAREAAYSSDSDQIARSVKALALKKADILKKEGANRLSLLIVEDSEDVLNFIKEGFIADFEVHTADNGLSGLELAKEINPDIIISDVMMPGMSGIELCGKLKTDIQTSHIPIILLTARSQLIFKIEGIEIGADDYITKPFNLSIVEARVWNLIENRQKLRERYQKEIKLDPQNITITNLDGEFLNKVLNYIEQHITDPDLSVELLSQEVAMSKSALYKKIKSLTNQTGIEFIRTVRLKRAAQLLAQGQLSVNEIAYMVGFMDVDYFRKCFKEQFKYTPKEHPVSKV